ncbi:MAG: CrcB family protein [Planctomycetes bacterium]|nr:CrcB family protein [Planctomycetota bacterium]
MSPLLLLAIAGACGALCRYGVYRWIAVEAHGSFPWATVAVNTLGSLLFGAITVLADEAELLTREQRVVLLSGFLGAFTTFSSFAFETATLMRTGHAMLAVANALTQNVVSVLAVFAGMAIARAIAD